MADERAQLPDQSEPCAWCQGTGTASAERNFILTRLRLDRVRSSSGWIGVSSTGMLLEAITGEPTSERPYDVWDLGRCILTRRLAPEHLHESMDAYLAKWRPVIAARDRWRDISEADKMADKYEPAVRADMEALNA